MRTAFLAALALASLAVPAAAQTVIVRLTGVQPDRGGPVSGVLSTREQFMSGASAMAAVTPSDPTAELVFQDVPPGDYALVVMHDSDNDRQFDMGQEGYAFSNSDGPLLAAPSFDAQRFTVTAEGARITVPMIYPPR